MPRLFRTEVHSITAVPPLYCSRAYVTFKHSETVVSGRASVAILRPHQVENITQHVTNRDRIRHGPLPLVFLELTLAQGATVKVVQCDQT